MKRADLPRAKSRREREIPQFSSEPNSLRFLGSRVRWELSPLPFFGSPLRWELSRVSSQGNSLRPEVRGLPSELSEFGFWGSRVSSGRTRVSSRRSPLPFFGNSLGSERSGLSSQRTELGFLVNRLRRTPRHTNRRATPTRAIFTGENGGLGGEHLGILNFYRSSRRGTKVPCIPVPLRFLRCLLCKILSERVASQERAAVMVGNIEDPEFLQKLAKDAKVSCIPVPLRSLRCLLCKIFSEQVASQERAAVMVGNIEYPEFHRSSRRARRFHAFLLPLVLFVAFCAKS
jgi:hypothetical protein